MNLADIKYRIPSAASLSIGSFLSQEDLSFYTDGKTARNIPFGQSEKDFVDLAVYTLDETFITSSVIYSVGTWTPHTNSYYNVFNKSEQYYYNSFTTDWVITGTESQSLFFDLSRNLNSLGISDGNYKIYIELGRNEVGNTNQTLLIDTISTSRNEITLIPKTLRGSTDSINIEYDIFSNDQIQVKDIADLLNYSISKPELYNMYFAAMKEDPAGSAALRFNYGFKQDVDVIMFITDLYYGVRKGNRRSDGQFANTDILGIYDQFKNWLYKNYNTGVTFQTIKDYYYSLFVYIADRELNGIVNKKPDSYPQIVNFLGKIYYNLAFFPHITAIENSIETNLSGYFKHYLRLSNGKSISILNKKITRSTDPRFYDKLTLKLESPLELDISLGSSAWITNDFGFLPIVQNLYYFSKRTIKTIPLRGPNFLIQIENEGNSTEALSMESLVGETGSLYNELTTKLATKQSVAIDSVDYRNFENFINYSSVTLRLVAFATKRDNIENLYADIVEYDKKLIINPNDQFYQQNKDDANNEISAIEAGMDGYEKFLYDNPMWFTKHSTVVDGYSSASYYDKNNGNSLINGLPQFIIEAYDENEDYIKFVGMIGHFFDNISLTAIQFTEKNNIEISPNSGISLDVVGDMLKSLGWDVEISKENLPLLLSSFCKADFDEGTDLYNKSRKLSEEQRNKIIWKRILNSLPLIYKTKGTETSLDALISCFGVPKNIIKIKEYGGIQNVSDLTDQSLYIVDGVKYEPYFSGSGEYFKINWTGSAQSLEFDFRFDTVKIHDAGKVFRLINCSDVWAVGVVRERGNDWGSVFFSIDNGFGNVRTIMTNRAPVFDGNSYHVLLRRNDIDLGFGATASYNEYPTRYDLLVQKSEDDRITYAVTGSTFLSGSYNNSFEFGSFVYIGNYNQNITSVNIDPEAFFGNIDDINIWESALSDKRFLGHTLNRTAYDLETPQQMVSENLFRISFERPVDLCDPDGVTLNNLSFRDDFPVFFALNFPNKVSEIEQETPCDPSEAPAFPYQFSRKDVRFTMSLPDYGSNQFRSNKINYIEQELIGDLSADTRASLKSSELISVDSNKLGIFFSPTEVQNKEIMRFFGEYPLGDLIGDPADIYQKSYRKFEVFKQIYYDQGFGNIDYQFFMNIVRFYFDKTMFKYIKSIIPARAKLIDGILVEPSILERPKVDLKPVITENVNQHTGHAIVSDRISGSVNIQMTGSLAINNRGQTICSDINQTFFPIDDDVYGASIYSQKGITFYHDEYYSADVIKTKKAYQVWRNMVLPNNALNEYERQVNLDGRVQTITASYYKVNLTKLPVVSEYPVTMSISNKPLAQSFYFTGKISFNPLISGYGIYTTTSSHTLNGTITGSINAQVNSLNLTKTADIVYPGLYMESEYTSSNPAIYSGNFYIRSGSQYFDGNISSAGSLSLGPFYYSTFKSSGSIFDDIRKTSVGTVFSLEIPYRYSQSLENYPYNLTSLDGYFHTHHKYKQNYFCYKEITAYDTNGVSFKWKKGSQNKKTTIDPKTGLLNNTEPVETKTV